MVDAIKAKFLSVSQALGAVQKYYGVVQRVTVPGSTEGSRETALLSCNSENSCVGGRFDKAVPDDSLTGISYVELRGTGQTTFHPWGYSIAYPVRFTAWLNAAKLGVAACGDLRDYAVTVAIRCLKTQGEYSADYLSLPVKATATALQVHTANPGVIFAGLPYQADARLFLHPFTYFAIDCTFTVEVPSNCISARDFEPVTCIEV